jgi:aminoglycoside phosphotransferase (APT) family kinase protein
MQNILQKYPEFQQTLDLLRGRWQISSLIHGDIKWDNCLVHAPEESGEVQLKIVDWELADFGDPCWDVGAVFQAYLSCWIMSLPIQGDAPPAQLVQRAQYPLEAMQPALRSFWQAYGAARQLDDKQKGELLERCVQYGAARMIQTAYEYLAFAPQITASALYLLQASLNILTQPREAIQHLLGL